MTDNDDRSHDDRADRRRRTDRRTSRRGRAVEDRPPRTIAVEDAPTPTDAPSTTTPVAADAVGRSPTSTFDLTEAVDAVDADDAETDDDAEADDAAVDAEADVEVDDPWTRPGSWYVVHTQSGYEKKVTANLHARIQSMNMEDKIFEVVIPMEEVVEFKNGRKQTVQRKVFPGYLLVRCVMDDESLVLHPQHARRHRLRRPEPPGPEAHAAVAPRGAARSSPPRATAPRQSARPKPKLDFDVGESVRVKEGPFADFSGEIAEINADHMKLKVSSTSSGARRSSRWTSARSPSSDERGRTLITQQSQEKGHVMAKKKVAAIVKIQIPAGKASPAPPVGTALGPHGVAHHGLRQAVQRGHRVAGRHDHPGRDHRLRGPHVHVRPEDPADAGAASARRPASTKAASDPGKEVVGSITEADIEEIAKIKMPDLNAYDLEAAKQQVRGTARSMGIKVVSLARLAPTTNRHRVRRDRPRPGALDHRGRQHMSGKKFADAAKKFDRDEFYPPTEALGLVKTMASAKFDENVDIAVRLGVDPRKADQMVRGTVALPSGTGKDVRVAVFATGAAAQEARDAGADIVGADDLAAQIEAGKFDFDLAIATPDMMPLVGRSVGSSARVA